jgi:hypothetical protein
MYLFCAETVSEGAVSSDSDVGHYVDSIFKTQWEPKSPCQELIEHTELVFRKTAYRRHELSS